MSVEAAHTQEEQSRAAGRVQSLDRAVALLNAVSAGSPEGRSAPDLAADCGLNRATAWRLLATLEHHGLVERDPVNNRYAIGFAISRMAATAGVDGLVRRAHGTLERLSRETGETANLAVAQRLGLTYVDEVAPQAVLSARWLGQHVPIHATSAGKALLAWLPQPEVESLLDTPLAEYTESTRTDRDALLAELAEIREQGYSGADGELESHVCGVSAPVLDVRRRPAAIVSIWGPRDRVPAARFTELGALVRDAAIEIGEALG
ncbi:MULTISPECIES: IclR family transcriptional regulator [unclassified Saccharopolyspora]|uniref:IclR family transcriptional regulator n=1 Tax=unclassified Saccharopolyspora TaxID=2646250 RepID=UPI001CD54EC0|nr:MULTISPECIES: IclR family transcriptional regulator [unclassified Saccharopolyspora]MCA1185004.1 IclR family transcriptional regulator [Saccharopolyspora sp. 6T]MCA1190726.1 IclR family transcriptional regulator [Saccharopolyspora sp. 6V]MCA1225509.1 IclR family transcriptional regulator [Saccharopolyspora sp. 6M]MCA1278190.1 IclR family transcriptional regulator [Saccharopolyspora sp. 7B]